jgi:hypothetical protein
MIAWSQRSAWKRRNDKNSVRSKTPLENAMLLQTAYALGWCLVFIGSEYGGSIGFIWHFSKTLPNIEYTLYGQHLGERETLSLFYTFSPHVYLAAAAQPRPSSSTNWCDAWWAWSKGRRRDRELRRRRECGRCRMRSAPVRKVDGVLMMVGHR